MKLVCLADKAAQPSLLRLSGGARSELYYGARE